jgi:hypothetical protein
MSKFNLDEIEDYDHAALEFNNKEMHISNFDYRTDYRQNNYDAIEVGTPMNSRKNFDDFIACSDNDSINDCSILRGDQPHNIKYQ